MNNVSLQIERHVSGTVSIGSNLIFDETTHISGNIDYDAVTGVITIQDPGKYSISWWVATQTTRSINGVVLRYRLLKVIY